MMSLTENISDYWQYFILAPVGFAIHKVISLNSRVSVNESKIATLQDGLNKLCEKHDETNNLLRELNGRFEEHFKK